MSDENLEIPDELKELMLDWKVSIDCRDRAIASVFKAKRAIYYGKLAERANQKFWRKLHELHPETKDGRWIYSFDTETVSRA